MTTLLKVPVHLPPSPKGHFIIGNLSEYYDDPLGFLLKCNRLSPSGKKILVLSEGLFYLDKK